VRNPNRRHTLPVDQIGARMVQDPSLPYDYVQSSVKWSYSNVFTKSYQ
jgi:hypothetical protein